MLHTMVTVRRFCFPAQPQTSPHSRARARRRSSTESVSVVRARGPFGPQRRSMPVGVNGLYGPAELIDDNSGILQALLKILLPWKAWSFRALYGVG